MHVSHADHGTSPPQVDIPRDYNAAHDLLARNAVASRQAGVHRRDDRRHPDLRPAHRAGAPLRQRAARSRLPPRRPRAGGHAGHAGMAGGVPRLHAGRRGADRRQHPADRARLRVHAARFARAGAVRLQAAGGHVRHHHRQGTGAQGGDPGRRRGRRHASPAWWPPARPSRRWRPPAPTTPASGSTPAAPPARPRARCTCTAT